MTKRTLLFILLSGFVFLLSPTQAYAVKIQGEWRIDSLKLKAQQDGDTFSLIITDPQMSEKYRGMAILKGTITGNTFTGQNLAVASGCPNLVGYKPASGTVSNTKIEVTTIVSWYDPQACTEDPGTETEDRGTYTKVLTPEEQALEDYQNEQTQFAEDLANRSGPAIDTSNDAVISTSPVTESERYPINVGADIRPDISTLVDPFYYSPSPLAVHANPPPHSYGKDIARISDFSGNLTIHKTFDGKPVDRQTTKVGTSIKSNVLHEGDTFSFKGDGFIQYHGVDGSVKKFMTAGYAKTHGYADQVKPGQAGIEIILKPSEPIVPLPVPKEPGPIQKFFNWLGELITPEPQPTPWGVVGVKG